MYLNYITIDMSNIKSQAMLVKKEAVIDNYGNISNTFPSLVIICCNWKPL